MKRRSGEWGKRCFSKPSRISRKFRVQVLLYLLFLLSTFSWFSRNLFLFRVNGIVVENHNFAFIELDNPMIWIIVVSFCLIKCHLYLFEIWWNFLFVSCLCYGSVFLMFIRHDERQMLRIDELHYVDHWMHFFVNFVGFWLLISLVERVNICVIFFFKWRLNDLIKER